MARDETGKPRETRGRRGTSQRIRDLNEQIKTWGELGGNVPKWIETITGIGFVSWIIWTMRPRVDVYGDRPIIPTTGTGRNVVPGTVFEYKGRAFTQIIIAHPFGRGGPFVLGEIFILLNLPSGDWFEIAEDFLAFGVLKDLFDNYLFPETPLVFKDLIKTTTTSFPINVEMEIKKQLVSHWLAIFAYAGFLLLLLKRAVVPRSG